MVDALPVARHAPAVHAVHAVAVEGYVPGGQRTTAVICLSAQTPPVAAPQGVHEDAPAAEKVPAAHATGAAAAPEHL